MGLKGIIKPDTSPPHRLDRDPQPEADRYVRSYLVLRMAIGFLGIALPAVLIVCDGLFLAGDLPRGSLSAYYHSGLRDVFVGTLFATAVFLITYKVVERGLDNTLSIAAGLAAFAVAVFPTNRPAGSSSPRTPLQDRLGESATAAVHYVAAAAFILLLMALSICFGIREGKRKQQRPEGRASLPPTFWKRFHFGCAILIFGAVVYIGVTQATNRWDDYSLLIGEIVAVESFGASWLAKGLELTALRGLRDRNDRRTPVGP